MKKILLATEKPFAKVAVVGIRKIIEEAGFEMILLEKYSGKEQLANAVRDANALIVRSDSVDRTLITRADNLEIVVRAGSGFDNIDLEACTERKIIAMNTPGQNSNGVAELVTGLMIFMVRNCYNGTSGTELRNKKLGIHAFGNIGRIVGTIGKSLGMEVYAHDPFVEKSLVEKEGIHFIQEISDLYTRCQFVSLHLPLNEQTNRIINYDLLSLMPENAVLINTARKELIDETDLLRLFNDRKDFKYASDGPPEMAAELSANFRDRIFYTPKKMGAQTEEANINAGLAAARQIVSYFKTGETTFRIN